VRGLDTAASRDKSWFLGWTEEINLGVLSASSVGGAFRGRFGRESAAVRRTPSISRLRTSVRSLIGVAATPLPAGAWKACVRIGKSRAQRRRRKLGRLVSLGCILERAGGEWEGGESLAASNLAGSRAEELDEAEEILIVMRSWCI